MSTKSFVFKFGDVEVREREFSVAKAGELFAVEPKAFRVLLILLRNPGKLITKEELLNAVWGDAAVTENSLTRSIALLRRLLGDDARTPRFIETVTTVGYRWLGRVEAVEEPAGASPVTDPPAAPEISGRANAGGAAQTESGVAAKTTIRSRWRRVIFAGAAVVVLLAFGFWYLSRPLPLPRVTAYNQITHDGVAKWLNGTDGTRLYFSYADISPDPVAQVAAAGGAITHIPIASLIIYVLEDVSPDGTNLLVSTSEKGNVEDHANWSVRIPGGPIHRLPDAVSVAFSPDGKTVAYLAANGVLGLVQSDGSGAHKLVSTQIVSDGFSSLAWSPDGGAIRFFIDDRLWEISSSGANLHEVILGSSPSSGRQCCGRWTPDGQFFVFLRGVPVDEENGSRGNIWALDERQRPIHHGRGEPFQLTTGPIAWGRPVPGKDGKTIFATGKAFRGELSRFDSRTGEFVSFLGGSSIQGVSFSKDGRFIAYVSYPEGLLWKANRDGSNPVQLTEPPSRALLPRWSPDGTQIVYTELGTDQIFSGVGYGRTYIVSAEGGSPRRLLPEYQESSSDPSWSPDGKKIVFVAGFPGPSALRILVLANHQVTAVPGSDGTYSPRWSPDGRSIAALPRDSFSIRIFDIEKQKWSEVPEKNGPAFPEWSSDSQSIYFLSANSSHGAGIFRLHLGRAETERVADLTNIHVGGWWNIYMGLDPTDAPLILRDVGSDDIYALSLEE